MRNTYHYGIGFAIAYAFFIIFKLNEFPLSLEYWNNYLTSLAGVVLSGSVGFIWEYYQSAKNGSFFDINDVFRSGVGGLIGGIFAFLFVSQTLMIALIIISAILVIRDLTK